MAESNRAKYVEPGDDDWSAGKLIALGAVFLAAFFVFIYNVSL